MNRKHGSLRIVIFILFYLFAQSSFANPPISQSSHKQTAFQRLDCCPNFHTHSFFIPGEFILQLGFFSAYQGETQHIGIQGLIGDRFNVTNHTDQNALVGLGYYLNGLNQNCFSLKYGLNAFFLPQTEVKGTILQEQLFTNLAYTYSVKNYPIYIATKAIFKTFSNRYNITFDLGIGPNIIQTSNVVERSLDGVTVPDHAFTGTTTAVFSATAGIGIRVNNIIGCHPIEVGYRYFYLGKGYFDKVTNQLTTTLNTGNSYANALVISTSF